MHQEDNQQQSALDSSTWHALQPPASSHKSDRSLPGMLVRALLPFLIGAVLFGVLVSYDADKSGTVSAGSAMLTPGTVLATLDEPAASRDYTLTFPAGTQETDLLIWDYAAEDGDWVQVKVNGTPMGDPFMIRHAPKQLRVPVGAVVEVVGVRDGGGGITYAVNFPAMKKTIRNGASVGTYNDYKLEVGNSGGKHP